MKQQKRTWKKRNETKPPKRTEKLLNQENLGPGTQDTRSRIWDRKKTGFRLRDKHPGSATMLEYDWTVVSHRILTLLLGLVIMLIRCKLCFRNCRWCQIEEKLVWNLICPCTEDAGRLVPHYGAYVDVVWAPGREQERYLSTWVKGVKLAIFFILTRKKFVCFLFETKAVKRNDAKKMFFESVTKNSKRKRAFFIDKNVIFCFASKRK